MLRDEMLYIEAEVAKVPPSHKVKDIASRSAYTIKVTDFVPFVNASQSQRAINRQFEY